MPIGVILCAEHERDCLFAGLQLGAQLMERTEDNEK